jgi:4-carboxymuconolactone decarboxylase
VMEDSKLQGRIPKLAEDSLSETQRSLLKQIEVQRGRVPTPYKIWIQSPVLAEPLQQLGTLLSTKTSLSKREREIAVLLMARYWQAEYVFEQHAREAIEAGLPGAVIADIRADALPEVADARERSIYGIVRDFSQPAPSNDKTFHDALAALGHNGLAELLVLCGYFTSVSLAMKLYKVPLPG